MEDNNSTSYLGTNSLSPNSILTDEFMIALSQQLKSTDETDIEIALNFIDSIHMHELTDRQSKRMHKMLCYDKIPSYPKKALITSYFGSKMLGLDVEYNRRIELTVARFGQEYKKRQEKITRQWMNKKMSQR